MMEDIRRLYKTSTSREDFANKIRDLPPGLYTRNDRTRYDKDIPFAKIPPDKVNTPGRPQPPDYPPGLDGIEQRLKDYETQRNREREWENEEARRYTQQKRDQERHFESNRNSGYEGRKEASSKETGRGFETFGDLTTHD
jgi:hypothetical protein